MFLTAVILILFFSLSDLAKWMNQNGATDKEKFFVVGGIFLLILIIINVLAYLFEINILRGFGVYRFSLCHAVLL